MIEPEQMMAVVNAPVAEQQPVRTLIDMHIDDCLWRFTTAATPEARKMWGDRATALIRERNAGRTDEEIEAIERARGLR